MVFGAATPDWWCVDDMAGDNSSVADLTVGSERHKACFVGNGTKSCNTFLFDSSLRSVVTEWSLVCDRRWIPSTITSIQFFGVLTGNLICGHLADLIGRKPVFYGAILLTAVVSVISIFSTSWVMFAALRFFIGLACGGHSVVMYSIQSEFTLARWRTWIVAVPSWQISEGVFALVVWLLKDWQYILIATAVVAIPCFATCLFTQESFRWKIAHGHQRDSERILRFLTKVNNTPMPDSELLRKFVDDVEREEGHKADRTYSLMDIIKSKELLKYSFILMLLWLFIGLSWFGIQFGVHNWSGSLYLNMFLISAVGIPVQIMIGFLQNRFGRKKSAALYFTIFAMASLVVAIENQFEGTRVSSALSTGCAVVALTFSSTIWSPLQTITLEIYPTVVRNIGFGVQNTMARIGGIIGPQLAFLGTEIPGGMFFLCTAMGIASILLLRPLPETQGANLDDNIHRHRQKKAETEIELLRSTVKKGPS